MKGLDVFLPCLCHGPCSSVPFPCARELQHFIVPGIETPLSRPPSLAPFIVESLLGPGRGPVNDTGSPGSPGSRPASLADGCRARPAEGTGYLRGQVQRAGRPHLQGSLLTRKHSGPRPLQVGMQVHSPHHCPPRPQSPAHQSVILWFPELGALSAPHWYKPPGVGLVAQAKALTWLLFLIPPSLPWTNRPESKCISKCVLIPAPYPELWASHICQTHGLELHGCLLRPVQLPRHPSPRSWTLQDLSLALLLPS